MADYRKLISLIRPSVRGRIKGQYRARFDTSDVTQECAVQLIKQFQNNENTCNHPPQITRAWLTKVGRGTVARLLRHSQAKCRTVDREDACVSDVSVGQSTPDEIAELNEVSARLGTELARLKPLESEIVNRHYRRQQSLNAIAEELGLPRKQVQRIHRAVIKKLKVALSQPTSSSC